MNRIILTILLLISLPISLKSQIGEVKSVNGYICIYNESGIYTGKSIYLTRESELIGYNNRFIIILNRDYVKIYDYNGIYTGHSIKLYSRTVKTITSLNILIKEGNSIKYYDFNGNFTGKTTYN